MSTESMTMDIKHDIHILISIARIDAELADLKSQAAAVPAKKLSNENILAEIDKAENESKSSLEEMHKEKRSLEVKLEENDAVIKKYKTQLLEIKTNKEYTALLKEIAAIEKDIDDCEEKLLLLMDEIDSQESRSRDLAGEVAEKRTELKKGLSELADKEQFLWEEISKLETKKPALLKELAPRLNKKYDRLLSKMSDFAVTNVIEEICQGCFSRMPPQTVNEVKKNDRIICCETCGRILVHY